MEAISSDGHKIKTGDKVLVRHNNTAYWIISIFSYKSNNDYICLNYASFKQCIPFEGNEELCGTNNIFTKVFIPEFGQKVKGIEYCSKREDIGYAVSYQKGVIHPYTVIVKDSFLNKIDEYKYTIEICDSVEPID